MNQTESNWINANQECKIRYNTQLGTILNKYENNIITEIYEIDESNWCWIGYFDEYGSNNSTQWEWMSNVYGNDITYINWRPFEPNSNDNCAVLNIHSSMWKDSPCSKTYRFVCDGCMADHVYMLHIIIYKYSI